MLPHPDPQGFAWRELPRRLLALPVRGYRFFLSPWLGSACRFEPTCSRYALQALEQHGALAGSYLMTARLLRCHPWCDGGRDDVPTHRPRLFSHLLAQASRPAVAEADASNDPLTSFSRPKP